MVGLTLLASFTVASAAVSRARGQDDATEAGLVRPYIEGQLATGIVVAIVDSRGTHVHGYGTIAREKKQVPDGDTIFEIGSVSKVFTSLLLADMVERKVARLDEPVRDLLPADAVARIASSAHEITLQDLATHTSGLPRMPGNLAPKDPTNPFASYGPKELYAFLAAHGLEKDPEAEYEYSNLAVGLLGHALSCRAGKSYAALLAEVIAGPLGMKDTCLALPEAARARFAQGYDADGEAVPAWDFDALAGCGGIRSTANDMVRFLRAEMGLDATPLAAAMALTQKRRARLGDHGASVGLAWHLTPEGRIWHNGQTGGFHSYVGFDPALASGVIVLANASTLTLDALGTQLLDARAGKKTEPLTVRPEVKLDPSVLDAYVGKYQLAPRFFITVEKKDGNLTIQATGQPRVRIHAASETRFFLRVVAAEVTFEKDAKGECRKLVLHQNGRDLPGERVK
jgi:CubicO group peptidase (beta-lactamase class C family)